MASFKNKIEYILKHNLFIQKTYKSVFSLVFKTIGFFVKTNPNLVLINSFGGRRYNDSSRTVYERIRTNSDLNHLTIVWAFEKPEEFDIPSKKVKIDTLQYFLTALKAKYWISNVNIERGLHFKKKQTRYLNTWHGIPLKLVGNAVSGRKDFKFSDIDIFCYSGSFEKDIYQRDFGVKKESMVMCGLPRNDELYNMDKSRINQLRNRYNIPDGKKVILYAPTWRESSDKGKSYGIKPPLDVNSLEKELGNEYVLIIRMHHFTTQLMDIEFNDFIRDGSSIQNINELLIISDVLISDYSATIFDYAILERPIISFAYDYDEYKKSRGFYFDLAKELPGGIIKTQEELVKKIQTINFKKECLKTATFKNKYLQAGGKATDICINLLFNLK
ncbi:MAG: CDP-glycerol glycerophosphotransferase family protein [Prolixibacteraceae bacterium]|nr:CDP-glycerol glycerophosphotransferase family protein [Prolixibacteraceae bacterium]